MSRHEDEKLLARGLHERADRLSEYSLDLDEVRGRAGSIRRRRRAVCGAVAAVVLAVAVPVGLNVAATGPDSAPLPADGSPDPSVTVSRAVDPSPSPSPSPDPRPGPERTEDGRIVLDAAAAPRGADPALDYLTGSVLHRTDGSTLALARRVDIVVDLGEVVLGFSYQTGVLTSFDAAGEGTRLAGDVVGLVGNRETGAAWVEDDGARTTAAILPVAGAEPIRREVPEVGSAQPVGLSADGTLVLEGDTPEGQRVLATDFESEPRLVGDYVAAGGVTPDAAVSAQVSFSDTGSCWALLQLSTGRERWDTCDYALGAGSPERTLVLGTDAYGDGIGGSTVALLDARTGKVAADYTTGDLGFTQDSAWEPSGYLLQTTYQDGTWYLLRLGPDGAVEQALDPVAGSELDNPWVLGQ